MAGGVGHKAQLDIGGLLAGQDYLFDSIGIFALDACATGLVRTAGGHICHIRGLRDIIARPHVT